MIERIMSNVICPMETSTGIYKIIEHCLLNNGQETSHSRNIILDDNYRRPLNGNLSDSEIRKLDVDGMVKVLKMFASKYLNELKNRNINLNSPIALYFPEISNKRITGNDLEYIVSHTYDELNEYLNNNKSLPLSELLNSFFGIEGLSAEHFSSEFLYNDSTYEDGEINRSYSKRIYMNLPRKSPITYEFGLLFIQKCIEKRIPFDMKLVGALAHGDNDLDGSIFYSKNKYYSDHIEILYGILNEHPEYKEYIGTPIYTGGQVIDDDGKSYMTISHSGGSSPTYNVAVDKIINYSYISCCCQIICNNIDYFSGKFDNTSLNEIKIWSNINSLNNVLLRKLISNRQLIHNIREQVYNFILFKRKNEELKSLLLQMGNYMKDDIKTFSSLINFGDLEHTKEPIYKDPSFIIYEKNHLSSPSSGKSSIEDKKSVEEKTILMPRKNTSELIKTFVDSPRTNDFKAQIISLIGMSNKNKISNLNVKNCFHALLMTITNASPEIFNENDLIKCQRIVSNIGRLSFLDETKVLSDIEEFKNELLDRENHKRK